MDAMPAPADGLEEARRAVRKTMALVRLTAEADGKSDSKLIRLRDRIQHCAEPEAELAVELAADQPAGR